MHLFHVTRAADWDAARASGRYEVSTLGRSLAEEGFVHCSREHQWRGILDSVFSGTSDPLVLLVIDQDRLTSPVVEEPAPDGQVYPHVYGPIDLAAVVTTVPVSPAVGSVGRQQPPERPVGPQQAVDEGPSFTHLMVTEMAVNAGLLLAVMLCSFLGAAAAAGLGGDGARLPGALAGIVVGAAGAVLVYRRRGRRVRAGEQGQDPGAGG